MVREFLISAIGGSIVALAGYLLIVKENQVKIDYLSQQVKELQEFESGTRNALAATKLFVVSAHPERDFSALTSLKKIQDTKYKEIEVMAAVLIGDNNDLTSIDNKALGFIRTLNIDQKDLSVYKQIVEKPGENRISIDTNNTENEGINIIEIPAGPK